MIAEMVGATIVQRSMKGVPVGDITMTVLGGRGSIPVSGPDYIRYGGNTSCFALSRDGVVFAIVDAGTGLAAHADHGLALDLVLSVFLTHYHWDHIQGLSMLEELWMGTCEVHVKGPGDPRDALGRAIAPPLFPVSITDAATIRFGGIDGPTDERGLVVTPIPVNHPQGAIGFRIEGPNRSIAIITDHESGSDLDSRIAEIVDGVDVLVHDAQYLPEEAAAHVGWGHSTYEDAVALAESARASELILTSHAPNRTDGEIDAMMAAVHGRFANAVAARQGLEVPL